MSYTITLSTNKKYINLKVIGDITRDSAMKQNIEAHAYGRGLGINKFLVDLTESRNVDSVTNNYQFAYEDMHSPDFDRHAKVAFLVSAGDHSHDFVETLAFNAGLDIKIFTDRSLAEIHLLLDS